MKRNLAFLFVFILIGCYTPNKAIKQVTRSAITYPEKTKEFVRSIFPFKQIKADTTTIYKKGKTDTLQKEQFIYVDCPDTAKNVHSSAKTMKVLVKAPCNCPETVDTVYTTITKTVKDMAEVKGKSSVSWWSISAFAIMFIAFIISMFSKKKQNITIK